MRKPKPEGRERKPRFKPKQPEMTRPNKIRNVQERVGQLTNREAEHEHFAEFQQQANSDKNPRGAAILIATNLELCLTYAIALFLHPDRQSALFKRGGALNGFSNKIAVGHAMDLYGEETYTNLELVRIIRNAFAHAHIPIGFDTPEIADACALLVAPKPIPPFTVGTDTEDTTAWRGLQRYRRVCDRTGHNFIWHFRKGKQQILAEELNRGLAERYTQISARPAALP